VKREAEPRKLSGQAERAPSRCPLAMLFIGVACSDLSGGIVILLVNLV